MEEVGSPSGLRTRPLGHINLTPGLTTDRDDCGADTTIRLLNCKLSYWKHTKYQSLEEK